MRIAAILSIVGVGNEVDWAGLAGFLKSIAYVVVSAAALFLAYGVAWSMIHQRKVTASIDSRLGHLEVGVNGIQPDEPPLIDKVRGIEARQHGVLATLNRICNHLGIPPHQEGTTT